MARFEFEYNFFWKTYFGCSGPEGVRFIVFKRSSIDSYVKQYNKRLKFGFAWLIVRLMTLHQPQQHQITCPKVTVKQHKPPGLKLSVQMLLLLTECHYHYHHMKAWQEPCFVYQVSLKDHFLQLLCLYLVFVGYYFPHKGEVLSDNLEPNTHFFQEIHISTTENAA